MSVQRPETASIPDAPGAYLFRDAHGRVVYVGKALSLRKRLASYWGRPLHPRTEAMTEQATAVEWSEATSEDTLQTATNFAQARKVSWGIFRYQQYFRVPAIAIPA